MSKTKKIFAEIAHKRMKFSALSCISDHMEITDGKIIAIIDPIALSAHHSEWPNKDTLLLGFKEAYPNHAMNIKLVKHTVQDESTGQWREQDDISLSGFELITHFINDWETLQTQRNAAKTR